MWQVWHLDKSQQQKIIWLCKKNAFGIDFGLWEKPKIYDDDDDDDDVDDSDNDYYDIKFS